MSHWERILYNFYQAQLHFTMLPAFFLSVLFVMGSIHAAHKFDILARPSDRGSHDTPTPRLGGAAVALAVFVVIFHLLLREGLDAPRWLTGMLIGGAYALVGGLLDDVLELPPRWKFLFQFAAAAAAVQFGFVPQNYLLPTGVYFHLTWWVAAPLVMLFIVFMMNAYNFMDGMDGQAGLFAALVLMSISMSLSIMYGTSMEGLVAAALAAALLGFFIFNHPEVSPENKTFMGDGGSQFIGFALAMLALRLDHAGARNFPFMSALILLSPFIWDVCYTLVRRLSRGENVFQAHRSHLYQRLLISGWSHGQTLGFNALLWITCAVLAQIYAWAGRVGAVKQSYLILALVGATMVLYTLVVISVETAARKSADAQGNKSAVAQ